MSPDEKAQAARAAQLEAQIEAVVSGKAKPVVLTPRDITNQAAAIAFEKARQSKQKTKSKSK